MNTINDIITATGLKETFIRRCLNEMQEVFKPYIKRGEKNRLLFESSALLVFDNIKQYKENGLSISEMKRQLSNINKQDEKQGETEHQTLSNTPIKQTRQQAEQTINISLNEFTALKDKLHQAELAKNNAENKLEQIEGKIKLLPAGGDMEKSKEMIALITRLKGNTKSKGFFGGGKVGKDWEKLEKILYSSGNESD